MPLIYKHLTFWRLCAMLNVVWLSMVDLTEHHALTVARFWLAGFLTIGVPTVCRKQQQYVLTTLDSLVSGLSRGHRQEVVIVVYLADQNETCRRSTETDVRQKYPSLVQSCLIRFLHPPANSRFYPALSRQSGTNSEKKARWRSKQNLDFSYLLIQCQNLSTYYLQLEDDVIAVSWFYRSIKETIKKTASNWVCIEFIELGFIGKLFHSSDLVPLATMIVDWYQHTPADDTYIEYYKKRQQKSRILVTPTLFQHIGWHSSLDGRLQKLKDPYFESDLENKLFVNNNPPANISTTMTIDFQHPPRDCYEGSRGYFLTSEPVKDGNVFSVLFLSLQNLSRIFVQTGISAGRGNILEEGVLELGKNIDCRNQSFYNVYRFHKGMVDVRIDQKDVRCIVIRVTADQKSVLMIKEISVFQKWAIVDFNLINLICVLGCLRASIPINVNVKIFISQNVYM